MYDDCYDGGLRQDELDSTEDYNRFEENQIFRDREHDEDSHVTDDVARCDCGGEIDENGFCPDCGEHYEVINGFCDLCGEVLDPDNLCPECDFDSDGDRFGDEDEDFGTGWPTPERDDD